jgi:Response regulator containing a CheY-like receiver domain and an HTH DNA-binding domain
MSEKITIAIADDEQLFRQGLKGLLGLSPELEVLFDAENGKDLIAKLHRTTELPQIVITDLKMPELNGVEATKIIHKDFPSIKVIALTSYFRKSFIINMLSIGAVAYLAKDSTPTHMIETIKHVAEKGFYYDEKVMKYVHENIKNPTDGKSTFDSSFITDRERNVLKLICEQKTSVEIADILNKSPRTIDGIRNALLLKTESKNLAGLVIFAIKNKLVSLEETM